MASDFINLCLNSLDGEMLEELVLLYVNEKHRPQSEAQRIGISGQAQNGVDVYAHVHNHGHIGYQSKAYAKVKLTAALFDKELKLCHSFTPPLDYYVVMTLNSRDAKLQKHARDALLHGRGNRVSIIALEDLASIVRVSPALKRQLYDFALQPSDMREIGEYLAPVAGATSRFSTQESDQSLPDDLRAAEEWVNNGMPLRALASLDARQDGGLQQAVIRIRCRALYSLEKYEDVLVVAQAEAKTKVPHAPILILGALAAEELHKNDLADELAASALDAATSATLAEAVGGCIRMRSKRLGASMRALEAFAEEHLGSIEEVAVALADSAASIGDPRRASHWFRIARQSRPSLALGIQINELATALIIATDESNEAELSRIIALLRQFLESVANPEDPSFRRVILTNLGAAYKAVGRVHEAAAAWDEALSFKDGQRDIWIHRCMLCEHDNHVPPPEGYLVAMHASDPIAKLAYASALISANRIPEAIPLVEEVIGGDEMTPSEVSIAHVERLRIRLRTDDQQDVIRDGLDQVTSVEDSLPILGWLSAQHKNASPDNKQSIDTLLSEIDPVRLSSDAVLAIATPIAMGSSGIALGGWVPRLREISFGETGELCNEHAASVLADIQADTLDLSGCIATLERIRKINSGSNQVLVRLAQAYYRAGDRKLSLAILQEAISAPDASALTVRNWAQLAASLGQRREARRFFTALKKPKLSSPNDYIWLMQARVILGVKEDDADAVELLRSGLVTPERASQVFALGANRKSHRPISVVDHGTIVAVRIDGEVDDSFFIGGEPGAPQLPGVRSLDPVSHPWVEQLIGQKSGAHIVLVGEPFDGKVAEIRSVIGASDFLYAEALRQISLSSKEQTGIQRISGDLKFQMGEAKKLLAARHKNIDERLDLATRGHFPASLMAEQFQTSPREFLFKSRSWTPRSHSGSVSDIEADQSVMDTSTGWILDATTVLLLAMIGAEDLAGRLFKVPHITKVALAELCDWRAKERELRRGVGQMNLDDEGRLYIAPKVATDRVELLAFWKKVEKIISQCRVIDVPTVELSTEAIQILDVLGPETLSTFHAGRYHGLTLISEEFNVRAFANASTGIPCAPLHALVVEACWRGWISTQQAMLWIARLIELGWTWIWFPADWLWRCMLLPEGECWQVLQALSSRIRTADPKTAASSVLTSLTLLDSGRVQVSDSDRYRKIAIASFPRLDAPTRKAIAKLYKSGRNQSREASKTAKELDEWAKGDDCSVPSP